ncbi:Peptidyl-prolyl cis-trans isomerase PpiD [Minicystis rosea]|nr:Peptidyl-prolyl cis-trans isomerase PpiD [Minicystis rosea]
MSKKTEAEHTKDEEEDLDEEDETSEDEDEHEKPARARARAHAHRDDHGHDDHHHDDDEDEDDSADDPYWWTPHAVLSVLVLLGVLGFFGVFNKVLGGIAAKPHGGSESSAAAAHTDTHAAHQETPRPGTPPGPRTAAPPGETYGARHLLVQYKGSMRAPATITRSEDEAKARATEAMKKAKGGAKFEDLVKEYSDEPGAGQRGGDLGTFRKGQMVPEFQNAVEKLKVNEVSDLVKTPFGYHVILRTK